MSFETLHQHMPGSFQQCPTAAPPQHHSDRYRVCRCLSCFFHHEAFHIYVYIYTGSKGMGMELMESRGSSSNPEHSSAPSQHHQGEQSTLPSLAGSGVSWGQPLLLGSPPAIVSTFA